MYKTLYILPILILLAGCGDDYSLEKDMKMVSDTVGMGLENIYSQIDTENISLEKEYSTDLFTINYPSDYVFKDKTYENVSLGRTVQLNHKSCGDGSSCDGFPKYASITIIKNKHVKDLPQVTSSHSHTPPKSIEPLLSIAHAEQIHAYAYYKSGGVGVAHTFTYEGNTYRLSIISQPNADISQELAILKSFKLK